MKFLFAISFFVLSQVQEVDLSGKWKIEVLGEKKYKWVKMSDDAAFSEITDKIVLTEKGEYILRSDSYKKSGIAELSFGYWKLQQDTLSLQSKFGDVLMYQFITSEVTDNKIQVEMIYSFE